MRQGDDCIYFPKIDAHNDLHQYVIVYPGGVRVVGLGPREYDFKISDIKIVKMEEDNWPTIARSEDEGDAVTIDYSRLANGRALLTLICNHANVVNINNIGIIN